MNAMDSAPLDRTILLHVPGGKAFPAYLVPVEGETGSEWAWGSANEFDDDVPEDWCDGICWAFNSYGKPSTQPIGWSEL